MRALVVHAHPVPGSYSHTLRDAVVAGLRTAGHDVDLVDLYDIGYRPWMTDDEHRAYDTVGATHPDPHVALHIEQLRAADALVLVYPTWWSGLPAIMKGWIDRTMLPGVAFRLDERTNKVKGALQLRHLVGVTTYGSPRWYTLLIGDAGRRTITRTIRLICGRKTKVRFHQLHRLDDVTHDERTAFLAEIEASFAALEPVSNAAVRTSDR